MGKRRERVFQFRPHGSEREGIDLVITRAGIEVSGHYDSIVGLEGGSLSWDELEQVRHELNTKGK